MRSKLILAAICVAGFMVPATAHHSHGNYVDTFKDIQGVVKEVHLVVPHSWVYLEVKDEKGEPQIWALEATGRAGLQRIGVDREYIKVRRPGEGAMPPAEGWVRRLPPRFPEGEGRFTSRTGTAGTHPRRPTSSALDTPRRRGDTREVSLCAPPRPGNCTAVPT